MRSKIIRTWKLVSGILSIILFAVVIFQSCAVGLANALDESGSTSVSVGVIVAILMLAEGIISIATRNSVRSGGNITLIIIFGVAAIIGFTGYGNFSDLAIWSGWCLINAVIALLALIMGKKKTDTV